MVTTTVTPTVIQSWFKIHERLLIVLMVLLAGSWGFTRYTNADAAKTNARAEAAEQALASQKETNAAMASQSAQVLAQYQTMCQSLLDQNSSLAAAAASRQAAVVVQQKTDATLPLADLANRLKTLGGAPETTVSVLADHVEITQLGAIAITQTLETIPALQANYKDAQAVYADLLAVKEKGDEVIADQGKQITGLNLAAIDQNKACKAQVATVKADARKSKLRWFKLGFLLGFGSGAYLGHIL